MLPTAPHVSQSVIPLDDLGLVEFIDDGHSVTDEITTLETPGHTPGHQVILVSSGGERAAIVGDLIHNPVQIHEPDWCAFVDTSPEDTRRSRRAFMDRAEGEEMIVAAGHFHPDRHLSAESRGSRAAATGRRCSGGFFQSWSLPSPHWDDPNLSAAAGGRVTIDMTEARSD